MRQTLKYCFWMMFIMLLSACSSSTKTATSTLEIDVNAFSTQVAATVVAQLTQTAAPSTIPTSTKTLTPKSTQTFLPTETKLPTFTVKGLRAAYTVKGNVYIHNSGEQPTQLTNRGMDRKVLLSDDGQKVVFSRGASQGMRPELDKIYSINADGSNEQALITGELLAALNLRYNKSTEQDHLVFIPGTHQMLFNTHQAIDPSAGEGGSPNYDLLLVDTDSAKITQMLAAGKVGNFQVSPNGKLIAVQTAGYIDILDIKGQVIHPKLVTYPEDEDHIWLPLFWTGDSSQLIVMLPLPSDETLYNSGWPLLFSTWKYSLNGSQPVETRLNPAPIGSDFSISPDGNWIAYNYYPSGKMMDDDKFGIYLGNLRTGVSQLLYSIPAESPEAPTDYYWNPSSTHFIVDGESRNPNYIWDTNGKFMSYKGAFFAGWLDNNHYLYGILIMGETDRDAEVSVLQQIPAGFSIQDHAPVAFVSMKK